MGLFGKIIAKITGSADASAADWDELKTALLAADLGPELSNEVVAAARSVRAGSATEAITKALTSLFVTRVVKFLALSLVQLSF